MTTATTTAKATAAPKRPAPPQWAQDQADAHRRADAGAGRDWNSPQGCACGACRIVREGRPRKQAPKAPAGWDDDDQSIGPKGRRIVNHGTRLAANTIIPPEDRLVVIGHARACATCAKFTRQGGACPGCRPTDPAATPVCHSDY